MFVKENRLLQIEKTMAENALKFVNKMTLDSSVKVILIVRIRGKNNINPKARKIFQVLRLTQLYTATFVQITKTTLKTLALISPYVTWGYPSLKTTRELIYKHGFATIGDESVPIKDNAMVESHLGNLGIICIEDIIHELFNCGQNFQKVWEFIEPFKLVAPAENFVGKLKQYKNGGDIGNRESEINDLVAKMN